jgi:hypothetical protein
MKRILAATALVAFGLAPTIGYACEYNDASMASANTTGQLGLQPAPQASKAPAPVVAKAVTPKVVKQAKTKAPVTDAKLAAAAAR